MSSHTGYGKVGPAVADDDTFDPQPMDNHLLLGLGMPGFLYFAKLVGWEWEETDDGGEKFNVPAEVYTRDETKMSWVTDMCGQALTGYDFCASVREYMSSNGYTKLSGAELLSERAKHCAATNTPEDDEGAADVNEANIFMSHIQGDSVNVMPGLMWLAVMMYIPVLEVQHIWFWVDFYCLRQCVTDFDLPAIRSAIGKIGFTCVCLPEEPQNYLHRSFCIFEVVATLKADKQIGAVWIPGSGLQISDITEELLDQKMHIDVKAAQTRNPADKAKIDAYVDELGEDFVNAEVLKAIKNDMLTMDDRLPS